MSVFILAQVIDTPDINQWSLSPRQKQEQVAEWKELTSPGPTTILMTVRCDIRYTAEEKVVYDEIKELWDNDTDFCQRLVVAFTFGDRQDENLGDELRDVCRELQSVLKDAGNRYVLFNNKAQLTEKRTAVNELLSMTGSTGEVWLLLLL